MRQSAMSYCHCHQGEPLEDTQRSLVHHSCVNLSEKKEEDQVGGANFKKVEPVRDCSVIAVRLRLGNRQKECVKLLL